jgi:hypothetical protein
MRRLYVVMLPAVLAMPFLLGACPSEPPPECIAPSHAIDESCAPGYVPNFTNVYKNTIQMGCGSTKSSCHSAAGHAGNMSFADPDTAYEQLLRAGQNRVIPGDPACSEMIVRTNSPGEDYQMPPGDALTAPERCALVQWVLQGALP